MLTPVDEVRDSLNHAVFDVVVHGCDQAKVQQRKPAVWRADQVPRVRICLHAQGQAISQAGAGLGPGRLKLEAR